MKQTLAWAEKLDEMGSKATIRLDDKSQQTGTVAGVFLAAALSFLKPDSLSGVGPHGRRFAGVLLLTGVVVLVCCVATCLSVTWLRFVPVPVTLDVMSAVSEDLAAHAESEIDTDVKIATYRELLGIWRPILQERILLNKVKARRLGLAQGLLATGIFVISVLLFTLGAGMILGTHH